MLPLMVVLVHYQEQPYRPSSEKSTSALQIRMVSKGSILPGKTVLLTTALSRKAGNTQQHYRWTLKDQPTGSHIYLPDTDTDTLAFTVTHAGTYTVHLATGNGKEKQEQELRIEAIRTPKLGMGSSVALPSGTPFALPKGVRLAGAIAGFTAFCNDAEEAQLGSGQEVQVCFPLQNITLQDVSFTLPAGFILISTEPQTQNGILLQPVPIHLPALSTTYNQLYLYCLNRNRLPSGEASIFTIGPVTGDPEIQELISLLERKKLSPPTHSNRNLIEEVQNTLWRITDGSGLTTRHRTELSELALQD